MEDLRVGSGSDHGSSFSRRDDPRVCRDSDVTTEVYRDVPRVGRDVRVGPGWP